MLHTATTRAVSTAVRALAVPLDIGFVFPPPEGQDRGFGQWTNRNLSPGEIMAMLPKAASANSRGGNIYMRLSPSAKTAHPGVVLLDDLSAQAMEQLERDGLHPCLAVETSIGNFQCWIQLVESGTIDYSLVNLVARHLAATYLGDPRAVSPRQPGRLPGFTNRKPKHRLENGHFPFVRIAYARPGVVARAGSALVESLVSDTGRAAAEATPEKPPMAATMMPEYPNDHQALQAIHDQQLERILDQVERGSRPLAAASPSEVDFAFGLAAIGAGWPVMQITAFINAMRPTKSSAYAERTTLAALRLCESRGYTEVITLKPEPGDVLEDAHFEANSP